MSDDLLNRSLRDRSCMKWNRQYQRRTGTKPLGITEHEFAASAHEGASSTDKVREYIKHRKHPSR
jgi:hypothetical protein